MSIDHSSYGNGGNMIIPDILKNVLGLKETRWRYQGWKKGGTRSQHGGLPSDPGGGPTPASAHEFLGPKWRVSWWQFGFPEGNMAPRNLPKYPNLWPWRNGEMGNFTMNHEILVHFQTKSYELLAIWPIIGWLAEWLHLLRDDHVNVQFWDGYSETALLLDSLNFALSQERYLLSCSLHRYLLELCPSYFCSMEMW